MTDRFMADGAPPWPPEGAPQPEIAWQDILDMYSRMIPTWLPAPSWPPPKPDPAFQHRLMARATKAFRVRPHQIGIYPPCACHPAPNPAARDYRRRTKHRRRRRK